MVPRIVLVALPAGPGVNRKTGVAFRGQKSWSVALQPGVYSYRSDKHAALRGSLVVTLPS